MMRRTPRSTLFPYTTLVRSRVALDRLLDLAGALVLALPRPAGLLVERVGRHLQRARDRVRSEEHTSELQSRQYVVCRLLLEKQQDKHRVDLYRDLTRAGRRH